MKKYHPPLLMYLFCNYESLFVEDEPNVSFMNVTHTAPMIKAIPATTSILTSGGTAPS